MATKRGVPLSAVAGPTVFLQDTSWPAEGVALEWGTGSGNRLRVKTCVTANTRNFAGLFNPSCSAKNDNTTSTDAAIAATVQGVGYALMTGTGAKYQEVRTWGSKLGGDGDETSPVYVARAMAAWADGDLCPVDVYRVPSAG